MTKLLSLVILVLAMSQSLLAQTGTFTIANFKSRKVLDITTQPANHLVQRTANDAAAQRWRLVNLNNGYYSIINTQSGHALGNGGNNTRGTQLSVAPEQSGALHQQWRVTDLGGKFSIVNRASGLAADVSGSSLDDNARILQWDNGSQTKVNQQWLLQPVEPPANEPGQVTNLPALYITTNNNAPIASKETWVPGQLRTAGGTHENGFYTGAIEIRGRGNSTWGMAKKPYRIRLASRYNMLGLPARERNWVLLANYADKSLMRNALAFETSRFMGFSFTPAYRFVDVFLNGQYQGNYMLTDHMEAKEHRAFVEEQSPSDVSGPAITGGYLVEVDGFADQEPVWFTTPRSAKVTVKYPSDDEINPQQKAYISNYFTQFENALFSQNYKNPTTGYRQYVDIRSMVDYYILSELTSNSDCFWSTYMTKRRNDPKLYTGPVWDFDIAFNNDRRIGDAGHKYMMDFAYANRWHKQLISDEYFFQEVRRRFAELKNRGLLTRLQHVTDSLSGLLQQSQQLNFQKWPILNQTVYLELAARGSFANEVKFVRDFVTSRFQWLDAEWRGLDSTATFSIANIKSGKALDITAQPPGHIVQQTPAAAASQRWRFVNLHNGYYSLVNQQSGLVLGTGGNNARGTQLRLDAAQANALHQQWRVINIGGKYSISNRASGMAANVSGSSMDNNARILQWDSDSYTTVNQQWRLDAVSPAALAAAATVLSQAQVYPNPVNGNPTVTVAFTLTEQARVDVMVYSLSGTLVKAFNKGTFTNGRQQWLLDLKGLYPGSYIIKIKAGRHEELKQLLIR